MAVIARAMKLVSVNVGRPALCRGAVKQILTGIYKAPVTGRVTLRTLNLDGDGQRI